MPAAGAIIGAAGAIGGSLISSNASGNAADAQINASNNATNAQLAMYNQTRADQSPWRTSGSQALSALDAWYGLPGFQPGGASGGVPGLPISSSGNTTGGGLTGLLNGSVLGMATGKLPITAGTLLDPQQVFDKPNRLSSTPNIAGTGGVMGASGQPRTAQEQQQFMMDTIKNQPGYQFQMDQGSQALQRSLAARGLLNSGAAAKELTQYGQGYATSASENYLNGLRSMAGLGQTSVQSTGMLGANAANQIGGNMIYGGNAAAAGYANQSNSINAGLGGLTNAFQNYWASRNPSPYQVGGTGNGGSGYSYNYNDTPSIGGYVTPEAEMADFYPPQINPMAFYQGAMAGQQMQMAPLEMQQERQKVAGGALNLDQLRMAMQLQRLRMSAAQQYLGSTEPASQPPTGGPGGAQAQGGNSGGISTGPQGAVAAPQGMQTGQSPLDQMANPDRIAQNARYGTFNAILSGGDPNKPLADAVSLQENARKDRIERTKLAAAPALEQVSNIVTSDDPGGLLVNNRSYADIYDEYATRVGGKPRDYSDPDKIRKAAALFGNDVRSTYGEAPAPMPFQFQNKNIGLGGVVSTNPITQEQKLAVPQQTTDKFVVKDPSAIGGVRVQEMTKAAGVAKGLAPADAQTLALATISPSEIKMAGDALKATGEFPAWLAGRDSFTRAIFGSSIAKRFEGSGDTQVALAAKAQEYKASGEVLESFTDGKSGPSQSLVAINTAYQHLGVLRPLVKALDTGGSQAVNKAQLAFQKQFGATAPVTFDAVKQFVTQEVAKANVPGGGVSAEREELGDSLSKANTFAQLSDVLDKYQQLMAGKTEALRTLWDVGTKGQHGSFDQFLMPGVKAQGEKAPQGFNPKPGVPTKHPSGATVTIHG